MNKPVSEVMTKESLVTAPEGTTLTQAEAILQDYKIEKLPVVDKDGRLSGLITFKDIQKFKNYPEACKDEHGRLRVGAAVGVTADTLERMLGAPAGCLQYATREELESWLAPASQMQKEQES